MKSVAVLLTCFNRVNTTIKCLEEFYKANIPEGYSFDIYLVDDNSPDNTGNIIQAKFPEIIVIKGSGNLFWSGGMSLAWETAAQTKDYDFYLWLNDDTLIFEDALLSIIKDSENLSNKAIITASCKSQKVDKITYGGRLDKSLLVPNGNPQECKYINGNLVLIPQCIYDKIGGISKRYTHSLGDFDYGLRSQKVGFKCYTSSNVLASCENNPVASWCNPKTPLIKRIMLINSPKGLNLREYLFYKKKHYGMFASIKSLFKAYIRMLMPKIYAKINNNDE